MGAVFALFRDYPILKPFVRCILATLTCIAERRKQEIPKLPDNDIGVFGWLCTFVKKNVIGSLVMVVWWLILFLTCIIFSRGCTKFIFNVQRIKNLRYFANSTYIAFIVFVCLTLLRYFGPIPLHFGSYDIKLDELLVLCQLVLSYYQLENVLDYGLGAVESCFALGEEALIVGSFLMAYRIHFLRDLTAFYLIYFIDHLIASVCNVLSFMSILPPGMTVVKCVLYGMRWLDFLLLPFYTWLCRAPFLMVLEMQEAHVYGMLLVTSLVGLTVKKMYDVYSGKSYLLAGIVHGVHPMGI